MGVTARSSELVVAATAIAFRHSEVAYLCALSLTNARICKPDEETPRSLPTCAGPARRTATIGPAEPLRDSAIAAESERARGAQDLIGRARRAAGRADSLDASRGLRMRGRNDLDHPQPCPCRGLHRRPELLQRESPRVDDDGVDSGVLHPREVRGTWRTSFACVPISTPQRRGCSVPVRPASTRACAAAGQSATASTAASAQSAPKPFERLGSGRGAAPLGERGGAALRCERRPFAAVGAAPTMTP